MSKQIAENLTTQFLLRGYGFDQNMLKVAGFINMYLKDSEDACDHTHIVYLLFKPSRQSFLQDFINKYEEYVEAEFDYCGGYCSVRMWYPIKYIHDYNMFLEGKFSKFSKEFKALFPKSEQPTLRLKEYGLQQGIQFTHSKQWMIINKDAKYRKYLEALIGDKIDEEQELGTKVSFEGTIIASQILNINDICITAN